MLYTTSKCTANSLSACQELASNTYLDCEDILSGCCSGHVIDTISKFARFWICRRFPDWYSERMGDGSPLKSPRSMLSPRSKRPAHQSDSLRQGIHFVNDDDAEKRQRKLEKALQLTTPRIHERRKSGGLTSGLTQTQMADHYSNCIKLSSENVCMLVWCSENTEICWIVWMNCLLTENQR